MLKDYWMCGIGPGTRPSIWCIPSTVTAASWPPRPQSVPSDRVRRGGGGPGGVRVLLLFHYFRDLCAAFCREKDPFSRLYQTAASQRIAYFLVQAMTDYSFYNYRVLFLFWAWLALVAGQRRRASFRKGAEDMIRVLNVISDTNIGGAGRVILNYLRYADSSRFETWRPSPEAAF